VPGGEKKMKKAKRNINRLNFLGFFEEQWDEGL
jgi:hypothetical protein